MIFISRVLGVFFLSIGVKAMAIELQSSAFLNDGIIPEFRMNYGGPCPPSGIHHY